MSLTEFTQLYTPLNITQKSNFFFKFDFSVEFKNAILKVPLPQTLRYKNKY